MNVANTTLQREANESYQSAINQSRARSEGVLTEPQMQWCRTNGVPLAFDPMQCGWVTLHCDDDLAVSYQNGSKYPPYTSQTSFVFRPWETDDAPRLATLLSQEQLWTFLPEQFPGPIDLEAAAALIELTRAPHHNVLAVLKGDLIIGQARLLFTKAGEAEVSYWLDQDHWGKGYGSRIVKAFCLRSLQERPELNRLFARVHQDHKASRRILEKAGFVQTGQDGQWIILDRTRQT